MFTLENESNTIPSGAINKCVYSIVLVLFLTAVCKAWSTPVVINLWGLC